MKQCQVLKAVQNAMIKGNRGRPMQIKVGDLFIVMSASHKNAESCVIDRKKTAKLGFGHLLSKEDILKVFELVD